MSTAKVILWGSDIGAVTWLEEREIGVFQYMPHFLRSGIQVSPLMMPLSEFPFEFPALARNTFRGLPGLLSDSLPDKFGNTLIDAWLASQGRTAASFNPVERLCYIGIRGMGALEFEPAYLGPPSSTKEIEIDQLVKLANKILAERANLHGIFTGEDDRDALEDILRVGTSAGGARAKAILAWNPKTNEFRSGQVDVDSGYEHWLLKFDGVTNNRDKEIADPLGYGKIEYAYHLMAVNAGIKMMECRLHEEGGRSHFMTKRFDRTGNHGKLHEQSLGAMAHFDFNQPASYSYEQTIQVIKRLELPREDLEQQVLRAFFNVIARNQDDHVKNIAFLMDRSGNWRLSPAFDMTYAWRPDGAWTSQHQMSINGKRDNFNRSDLIKLANIGGIKSARANEYLDLVIDGISNWLKYAEAAGVGEENSLLIGNSHRINI
ncbi:MAG: type II toxin-antitoxin system HipA family toxin [Anaerolineales bacterium]